MFSRGKWAFVGAFLPIYLMLSTSVVADTARGAADTAKDKASEIVDGFFRFAPVYSFGPKKEVLPEALAMRSVVKGLRSGSVSKGDLVNALFEQRMSPEAFSSHYFDFPNNFSRRLRTLFRLLASNGNGAEACYFSEQQLSLVRSLSECTMLEKHRDIFQEVLDHQVESRCVSADQLSLLPAERDVCRACVLRYMDREWFEGNDAPPTHVVERRLHSWKLHRQITPEDALAAVVAKPDRERNQENIAAMRVTLFDYAIPRLPSKPDYLTLSTVRDIAGVIANSCDGEEIDFWMQVLEWHAANRGIDLETLLARIDDGHIGTFCSAKAPDLSKADANALFLTMDDVVFHRNRGFNGRYGNCLGYAYMSLFMARNFVFTGHGFLAEVQAALLLDYDILQQRPPSTLANYFSQEPDGRFRIPQYANYREFTHAYAHLFHDQITLFNRCYAPIDQDLWDMTPFVFDSFWRKREKYKGDKWWDDNIAMPQDDLLSAFDELNEAVHEWGTVELVLAWEGLRWWDVNNYERHSLLATVGGDADVIVLLDSNMSFEYRHTHLIKHNGQIFIDGYDRVDKQKVTRPPGATPNSHPELYFPRVLLIERFRAPKGDIYYR